MAGTASEALKDFSGGVHMNYMRSKCPSDLWDVMNRAVQCDTMSGCKTYAGVKDLIVQTGIQNYVLLGHGA